MKQKFVFSTAILILFLLPFLARGQDVLGQETAFNIEPSYDIYRRTDISALLVKISPTAYWYADKAWWQGLAAKEQEKIEQSLNLLAEEFEDNIYPNLTRTFGSEWNPGIDKDTRLTILLHEMDEKKEGYFRSADEEPKIQIPSSNEREMIYLNSRSINSANIKSFLAHEFMHLITFNQKDKRYNLSEDRWLNEGRSEYVSSFLGYDNDYEGSNLQKRVRDFLDKPSDSLTEWRDTPSDYGVVNLFMQYLADHYGIGILTESLKLRKIGIESLNAVLAQQGFKEDFSQIFANWTVAVLINNCQVSEKYCYYNQNLKDFRIIPLINYLPFIGNSTLSVTNSAKDWSGNWHRFIGGDGTMELEFRTAAASSFKIPYVIEKKDSGLKVDSLLLDSSGLGKLRIDDFNLQNIALTIIPIAQNKFSDFSGLEPSRSFSWSASTSKEEGEVIPILSPSLKPISQMTREEILARISEIKILIAQLQAMLAQLIGSSASCKEINQNLYLGMKDNIQVKCLQEFLKSQGS